MKYLYPEKSYILNKVGIGHLTQCINLLTTIQTKMIKSTNSITQIVLKCSKILIKAQNGNYTDRKPMFSLINDE